MAQEYTTIRVTQDAKETAQQSKRDSETWNDYIKRCTDNPPEVVEYVEQDELATRVASRIDYAAIGRAAAEQTADELQERGL